MPAQVPSWEGGRIEIGCPAYESRGCARPPTRPPQPTPRPALQAALLSEVSAAWLATMRARRGIFAPSPPCAAAAGPAGGSPGGSAAGLGGARGEGDIGCEGFQAHHTWLAFLLEVRSDE